MSSKAFQVESLSSPSLTLLKSFYLVFIVPIIYSQQISIFMKQPDHEAP